MELLPSNRNLTNGSVSVRKESSPSLPAAVSLRNRYTPNEFLVAFSPAKSAEYAIKYQLRCIIGNAPTLYVLTDAYNEYLTKAWLMIQIINLNKAVLGRDVNKKMTPDQIEVTAETMMASYSHLKCTDYMLFFVRFQGGKHGKFYGSVDMIQLCSGLDDYCIWRNGQVAEYQKEVQRKESKKWLEELKSDPNHQKYMSYDEWYNSIEGAQARMLLSQEEINKVNQLANKLL